MLHQTNIEIQTRFQMLLFTQLLYLLTLVTFIIHSPLSLHWMASLSCSVLPSRFAYPFAN